MRNQTCNEIQSISIFPGRIAGTEFNQGDENHTSNNKPREVKIENDNNQMHSFQTP